jgi:hypothetical protein
MDYKKVYDSIICNASNRLLEGYKESHHVIPKCMGGLNTRENLVDLTAKEHYICHRLLVRIYPDNVKLKHAFWMMANALKDGRYYRVSSRAYQEAKKFHIESISGDNNPNKKPKNKFKISETMKFKGLRPPSPKGKVKSEAHRKNLSNSLKGRKKSEEHRLKNSQSHIGLQRGKNSGSYKPIDNESFKNDIITLMPLKQVYSKYKISQTVFYNRLEEIFGTRKLRDIRKLSKWIKK